MTEKPPKGRGDTGGDPPYTEGEGAMGPPMYDIMTGVGGVDN